LPFDDGTLLTASMKNLFILFPFLVSVLSPALSQTNIISTNPLAEQILLGNYDPLDYEPAFPVDNPDFIAFQLENAIIPDSLRDYLFRLAAFGNRNTGSDTTSATTGIGAARRWAYQKFQQFSAQSQGRLIPSYLQFDRTICFQARHRNVFSVLPGRDISDPSIILIEGHLDSRCEDVCGINCTAHGADDNGSGSVLVLELARVLSRFVFDHTIVFMLTIGEEQGLYGAQAFADYAVEQGISIKAVFNNDIVGGILCGETASQPGCTVPDDVDSTRLRIFSSGGFNSPHKSLARFTKLEYKELLRPYVSVPMAIEIMSPEDRSGRGGDHIPFRENGFTSIRLTAANEHGNASIGPGYTDRQHTSADLIGLDTDGDMAIDSFFVDFNYLARNTRINAVAVMAAAAGPEPPQDFAVFQGGPGKLIVGFIDPTQRLHYRVGVRTVTNDWDSVYTITGTNLDSFSVAPALDYFVSVASVDSNGVESLFSEEKILTVTTGLDPEMVNAPFPGIRLLQNRPNPFDEATTLSVWVEKPLSFQKAVIKIFDSKGSLLHELPVRLDIGMNESLFVHDAGLSGMLFYRLEIDGIPAGQKAMLFAY
jgi:hypothetical protein